MIGIIIINFMTTMEGRYLTISNVVQFNLFVINIKIRSANMLGRSLEKPQLAINI